jgi:hypothetical protein
VTQSVGNEISLGGDPGHTICIGKRKISLSKVFAGQLLGIREVDHQIWLVSFLNYDLGFFDEVEGRVELATNPFLPENLLTMSSE